MSDKHTAALDHMSALTEARVLELFDEEFGLQDLEVADAEIMAFALSIETEVRKQLDGDKIRATEGQAQTSAAIQWREFGDDEWCDLTASDEKAFKGTVFLRRAAQSADKPTKEQQ